MHVFHCRRFELALKRYQTMNCTYDQHWLKMKCWSHMLHFEMYSTIVFVDKGFVCSLCCRTFYWVSISKVLVGGLTSTSTLFNLAVFDIGTTLTYLDTNSYNNIVNAVRPLGSIWPSCLSKLKQVLRLIATPMCFYIHAKNISFITSGFC